MGKYQFTPSEIEDLERAGIQPTEIANAKQVVYSFEDWLKGDPLSVMTFGWGIRWHYLDKNFSSTTREKGELTIFILPKSEWLKMEQYKEEKLRGFVSAYFEALVESFMIKEKNSLEPLLLTESELEKVKNLIEDKFPKCTTGWVYSNFTPEEMPSLWLRYRNDCGDRSNISYWFNKICVNGENAVNYVGRRHTTLTANELNSLHPDDLHFVVSALAFHRFKNFLNENVEALTPIALTFKDWENGKFPEWAIPLCEPFEKHIAKDQEGRFRHYTFSKFDYQRIADAQKAILKKQVAVFLKSKVEDFEEQFSNSLEPGILLKSELQIVNEWLTNEHLSGVYTFKSSKQKAFIFTDLEGLFLKPGEAPNRFPYWYNEIVVKGKDASKYLQAHHSELNGITIQVAVIVLYKYKQYLEGRSNENLEPLAEPLQTFRIKAKALEHLNILSGFNIHGRKILPDDDFQRLECYVKTMIETGRLPDGMTPISKADFQNGHLRYLFHCIHSEQYAKREIQEYFIDFLHTVFPQFTGKKEITKHKFGEQPTTWERDLEKMKSG